MSLREARHACASFLAHTCPRDTGALYLMEAAPPRRFALAAKYQKLERDRMRVKIAGTDALVPKLRAALNQIRTSYLKAAKLLVEDASGTGDEAAKQRYTDALEAIDRTALGDAFTDTLEEMFTAGASSAVGELGLTTSFNLRPQKALDALYHSTMTFAQDVTEREVDAIKATIAQGMEDGLGGGQIGARLQELFDFVHVSENRAVPSDSWANMVARTEVSRAHNAGITTVYKQAKIARIMWLAAEDERTCPECEDLDGVTAALGEDFEGTDADGPPLHPDCVISGTMVTSVSVVNAATVRDYVGDVFRIRLANGHELTATPNHPIATRRGWVPISLLQKTDDVLCRELHKTLTWINPKNKNIEAAIEQVADSFAVRLTFMPTAAEDFHGDGAGSKVHVIGSNRQLLRNGKAGLDERLHERELVLAHVAEPLLDSARTKQFPLGTMMASPDGGVSGGSSFQSIGGGAARGLDPIGFADIAHRNRFFKKSPINNLSADSKRFCESLLTLTGEITASNVVVIERMSFQGKVFNLETGTGWYSANGIVTHNCRCTTIAADDAEDPNDADANDDDDADDGGA